MPLSLKHNLAILLMAIVSFTVVQAKTYRHWIEAVSMQDTICTWPIPSGCGSLNIEACIAMDGPVDGRGRDHCSWQLVLTLSDGTMRTVSVGWGNTDYGDFTDTRYLWVDGVTSEPVHYSDNVDLYSGDNTIIIDMDTPASARVFIGNDIMNYVGEIDVPLPVSAVSVMTDRKIELAFMSIECELPPDLDSGLDYSGLEAACASGQKSPLGLWRYFDRDNDAAYARPGGLYTLAVVEDPDAKGQYLMLYIDGARVNAGGWSAGMIKGRLIPTRFTGRYRLEWWDAYKHKVADEANAIIESEIITLNFPLLHTQMRYCR